MLQKEQRALLFVVDKAEPAVDLVAALFRTPRHHRVATDSEIGATYVLTGLLRDDGYEVGLMVAGCDITERLSHSPRPDALVADVSTPQGGALDAALQARRMYPNLPIFVITNHPELVERAQSELHPPAQVFTKPIDYERLSLALRRAARKHSGEYVRIPSFLLDSSRRAGGQGRS